ncbi:MAG: hypothetical protein EPN21_08975 [Methylococcaceae bacterium]|nr:MAG: hypothetical protein EPN21_08975 [Methylococcaceae bacterium]
MSTAHTTLDDIWQLFRETDRIIKEFSKETDRKIQETDRKFQETDRSFRESDRKLNKLEDLFTSQWGRLMESLVEGDLVNILNRRGLAIGDTTTRLKGRRPDGGNFEFDILAHNGQEMVVIEVKTTLRPQDVKKFIDKLNHIKQWVPRYANNTIYGGVAWLTAAAGAGEMAESRGLFSIRATGDSAAIVNSQTFHPRSW